MAVRPPVHRKSYDKFLVSRFSFGGGGANERENARGVRFGFNLRGE